jgi:hypothetical protein
VPAGLFCAAAPVQVTCSWAAQGGTQGWAGACRRGRRGTGRGGTRTDRSATSWWPAAALGAWKQEGGAQRLGRWAGLAHGGDGDDAQVQGRAAGAAAAAGSAQGQGRPGLGVEEEAHGVEGCNGGAQQGDAMQQGDALGDGGGGAGKRAGKREAKRCEARVTRAGFIGHAGADTGEKIRAGYRGTGGARHV